MTMNAAREKKKIFQNLDFDFRLVHIKAKSILRGRFAANGKAKKARVKRKNDGENDE